VTDRDKLPVTVAAGHVVQSTDQLGSLVTRGLEAIKGRQNEPFSLPGPVAGCCCCVKERRLRDSFAAFSKASRRRRRRCPRRFPRE
jgi:hypothetical protein